MIIKENMNNKEVFIGKILSFSDLEKYFDITDK